MTTSPPIAHHLRSVAAKSRSLLPGDGWGLRLFWVGSHPERFALVALGERGFDAALAGFFGLPQGASTSPWAHAPGASSALARACLSDAGEPFEEFFSWEGHAGENTHGSSRRANSCRFFIVPPGREACAEAALLSRLPGSWTHSRQGAQALQAAPQPLPAFACEGAYFSHPDSERLAPFPQVQIDAKGRAHWLWLPAAARALGAPATVSVSEEGQTHILAWGDILGAANRAASEDAERFVHDFAGAILPWSAPMPGVHHDLAPAQVHAHFLALDRGCVELEEVRRAAEIAGASRAAPRL